MKETENLISDELIAASENFKSIIFMQFKQGKSFEKIARDFEFSIDEVKALFKIFSFEWCANLPSKPSKFGFNVSKEMCIILGAIENAKKCGTEHNPQQCVYCYAKKMALCGRCLGRATDTRIPMEGMIEK